jgi:hypothetical protein
MHHRTDAAGRIRVFVFFVLLTAGCMPLGRRDPEPGRPSGRITPVNPAAPTTPPVTLPSSAPLAITTPPATGDIRPVAHQVPETQATVTSSSTESDPVRRLQRDAAASYAKLSCYIARMRRREVVQGRQKPEEVLIFKFREKPFSVHFKWLGDEGKGREVVYVRGQFEDKLHVLTAANDIPLTPAGRRLALAPDSMLVRSSSRYPITEAGIGNMIARFGRLLDSVRTGSGGVTMKYLGPVQRPEYAAPLEGVECQFVPGRDPDLPDGGKRLVFFDPATHFIVLSQSFDPSGREVEFYCFDRFQLDVKLDDDDFNPDKLWTSAPRK